MKPRRMLRPMMVLGILEILLAVGLWFANPEWRSNTGAILLFILALFLGFTAVVSDLISFANEIKSMGKKPPKA